MDAKSTKIILSIDTTSSQETILRLIIDGQEFIQKRPRAARKEQEVLQMANVLLHQHTLTLSDLHAIEVNPGPGSFTGTRVGVAIANTLGFTLHIPVNGKESIEPIYQ